MQLDVERPPTWLSNSVGYEVYIRSFADSDGDGIGDLVGLHDHLDHLAWLGTDVVWITPFYPSPMADHGYDVSDYIGIDPMFGTLDDFDRVVGRAHELDLRVVIDIVPNHTSDRHPWFQAALDGPGDDHRDYYIWRDPAPDGGPPNNWISHFGGPAWTLDKASGQYYLHLFLPEQPDLNWRNPAVHREFDSVLRFWLDRGVDGFRIDVAHALCKDDQFRDNPMLMPFDEVTDARYRFACMDHRHDLAQPETLDIYRSWRRIAAEYDAALIGETYVLTAPQLAAMLPGDGLHLGFWFMTMHMGWGPGRIARTVRAAADASGAAVGWVLSSHDESRAVTRFGGGQLGRDRSLALSTLLMGLPGVPFLFQGEELGLDDGLVASDRLTDPVAVRNDGSQGRDPCRTPMPWDPGPNLGFSTAASTWLPVGHTEQWSVASQTLDPDSHLNRVRELIDLRRKLLEDATPEPRWLDRTDGLVGYTRGDLMWVLNAGDDSVAVSPGGSSTCLFVSAGATPDESSAMIELEPNTAMIVLTTPGEGR